MYFIVGFYEASILHEASGHSIRGRFPHLRFLPVDNLPHLSEIMESIPPHIADILYTADSDGRRVNVLLAGDIMPIPSYLDIPEQRVVTWHQLQAAYNEWMENYYLPGNAVRMTYTPMALKPVKETFRPLAIDLIGGCSAQELQLKFQEFAKELGFETTTFFSIRNAPIPVDMKQTTLDTATECDHIRVVLPPFRAMHPHAMDRYYCSTDYDLFFEEVRRQLSLYLESVLSNDSKITCIIIGFIVPAHNPLGLFIDGGGKSNLRTFVLTLNKEIEEFCASRPSTMFIDGDAIASLVGKGRVDDGLVNFYGHRGYLLDYDGPLDEDFPVTDFSVTKSFEIGIDLYLEHLVREILFRHIIMTSEAKVKLVIVDLDNTLWRGLASDMRLGSWEGRPLAIVEALLILKKRGILLAIVSKNDEDFIRGHWREIIGSYAVSGLGIPLTLDDFAMVRINFKPKAENIREILDALNIMSEHALFIDDNSLEREAALAAFPSLRTLGAEPNYIRRELLYSPYLQNIVITEDDLNRTEVIKKRVEFCTSTAGGNREGYLENLGLRCILKAVSAEDDSARERALQLLNKTNQWNLNGRRIDAVEMARACAMELAYTAEVADSGSSYGTVVVMVLSNDRKQVDYMAVSCRVIGMGVDEAVVSEMVKRFGPLKFAFVETDRNRAARSFFQSFGYDDMNSATTIHFLVHPSHITSFWDETERE